jgi:hypothetical protein
LDLSDAEVRALDERELKRLMRTFLDYRGRVAYIGNRPVGELAKLLEDGKRYSEPPARKPVKLLSPAKTKIYFTHREMVQAQLGLSAPDGALDLGRILDGAFLGSYVGGGMSSLLFQQVREARSLAYAVHGGYSLAGHKDDDNEVYGYLGCQADKTVEAAELLAQLLREPPFTERRFLETRKALEENYRTNPIVFRYVPNTLFGWEEQGIAGGDPRPARFQRLLTYGLDDLKRFAARLAGRPQTLYLIGDRTRVDLAGLKALGDVEEKKVDELFPY